jgi:hypothetical protein
MSIVLDKAADTAAWGIAKALVSYLPWGKTTKNKARRFFATPGKKGLLI